MSARKSSARFAWSRFIEGPYDTAVPGEHRRHGTDDRGRPHPDLRQHLTSFAFSYGADSDSSLESRPGPTNHQSGGRRALSPLVRQAFFVHRVAAAPVVVFDAPLALLLLAEPDVEVEVEIAAERGRPGKRPPHRRLYACSFARGARETAESVTSWLAR